LPDRGPGAPHVSLGRLVEDQVVAVGAGVSELRLGLGAVHDARVALRRLRATLSVFRPVLDDVPASLTGDLRWFAGQVAATRDAEVATERLAAQLIGHLARSSDHAAAAVLEDHLGRWTAEAAVAARATLADPRTDQLLQGLGRLHLQASTTPQIYLEIRTQRLVVRTLEDLCDDLPVALAANGLTRGRHARVLHAQRKKVKAARAVTGVLDVTAEQRGRLDKALRAVQELLGDHHDAAVLRSWLARLAIREPVTAELAQVVRKAERAAMTAIEEQLPRAVGRLVRRVDSVRRTPAVHLSSP
jgi:CHAD domain-containing protein